MRSERERLLDIIEAIDRIHRYATSRIDMERSELVQNWVILHMLRIGEAAFKLPEQLKAQYPSVPWDQIVGMRHILVHNYFGIDMDVIAAVLDKDLTSLKAAVGQILMDLDRKEPI